MRHWPIIQRNKCLLSKRKHFDRSFHHGQPICACVIPLFFKCVHSLTAFFKARSRCFCAARLFCASVLNLSLGTHTFVKSENFTVSMGICGSFYFDDIVVDVNHGSKRFTSSSFPAQARSTRSCNQQQRPVILQFCHAKHKQTHLQSFICIGRCAAYFPVSNVQIGIHIVYVNWRMK